MKRRSIYQREFTLLADFPNSPAVGVCKKHLAFAIHGDAPAGMRPDEIGKKGALGDGCDKNNKECPHGAILLRQTGRIACMLFFRIQGGGT